MPANIAWFPADSTDVKTTVFMKDPAKAAKKKNTVIIEIGL